MADNALDSETRKAYSKECRMTDRFLDIECIGCGVYMIKGLGAFGKEARAIVFE